MSFPNHIFIQGPVPTYVEQRLRRLCAQQRQLFGKEYGETFSQVVEAGIAAIEAQKCHVDQNFISQLQSLRSVK